MDIMYNDETISMVINARIDWEKKKKQQFWLLQIRAQCQVKPRGLLLRVGSVWAPCGLSVGSAGVRYGCLSRDNDKIGMLKLTMYRPFSDPYLTTFFNHISTTASGKQTVVVSSVLHCPLPLLFRYLCQLQFRHLPAQFLP